MAYSSSRGRREASEVGSPGLEEAQQGLLLPPVVVYTGCSS